MKVAGIDVSSWAIDIVTLPLDEELDATEGSWHRCHLEGADAKARGLTAANAIPRGTFWDEIVAVAIEQPFGRLADKGALFSMHVGIGAVTAAMPEALRPPRMLGPSTWRKHAGAGGAATKSEVRAFALRTIPGLARSLPQDVYDAVCIARAMRALEPELGMGRAA